MNSEVVIVIYLLLVENIECKFYHFRKQELLKSFCKLENIQFIDFYLKFEILSGKNLKIEFN